MTAAKDDAQFSGASRESVVAYLAALSEYHQAKFAEGAAEKARKKRSKAKKSSRKYRRLAEEAQDGATNGETPESVDCDLAEKKQSGPDSGPDVK